jgi:uncharacterized delta-60 repeat protein
MTPLLHRSTMIMVVAALATTMALGQQPFDLDPGFRTDILTSGVVGSQYVNSIQPMPDGTLILSGQFRFPGDQSTFSGARLAQNGGLINHIFQMGGRITPWIDQFYCGNGQTVKRFSPNWSWDPTFDMLSDPLMSIFQGGDYHVFPDGRVVVTGSHTLNDPVRGFVGGHQLIWLQNNGYLDTTRIHRKCNGILWTLKEQPDGKFLVGSWCTEFEGRPVGPVFRMHADGALDTTFTAPMLHEQATYLYAMHTYADGRILLGGVFTALPGYTDTIVVVRLLPDGSLDPSFTPVPAQAQYEPPHRPPSVRGLLPLDDDRLIVTGTFDHLHGEARGGIAMLNADGSLSDEHFVGAACGPYNSPNGTARRIGGIMPSADGNYYIWGTYHGYTDGNTNDPAQRFVSRLYGLNVGIAEQERINFKLYPNPASTQVTVALEQLLAHGELLLRDALGREVHRERIAGHYHTVEVQGLPAGLYLLELWAQGKRQGSERVVVSAP